MFKTAQDYVNALKDHRYVEALGIFDFIREKYKGILKPGIFEEDHLKFLLIHELSQTDVSNKEENLLRLILYPDSGWQVVGFQLKTLISAINSSKINSPKEKSSYISQTPITTDIEFKKQYRRFFNNKPSIDLVEKSQVQPTPDDEEFKKLRIHDEQVALEIKKEEAQKPDIQVLQIYIDKYYAYLKNKLEEAEETRPPDCENIYIKLDELLKDKNFKINQKTIPQIKTAILMQTNGNDIQDISNFIKEKLGAQLIIDDLRKGYYKSAVFDLMKFIETKHNVKKNDPRFEKFLIQELLQTDINNHDVAILMALERDVDLTDSFLSKIINASKGVLWNKNILEPTEGVPHSAVGKHFDSFKLALQQAHYLPKLVKSIDDYKNHLQVKLDEQGIDVKDDPDTQKRECSGEPYLEKLLARYNKMNELKLDELSLSEVVDRVVKALSFCKQNRPTWTERPLLQKITDICTFGLKPLFRGWTSKQTQLEKKIEGEINTLFKFKS